jgi:hypothetical protein
MVAFLCGMALAPALHAADFLFTWKASSDPAVAAYGIYQRDGTSSYSRIDIVRVQDLDDPTRPSYLATGLGDGGTFWFAATAISASGAESDSSDQTCVTVNGEVVECSDEDDDGASVYVSCFISAAKGGGARKPAGC